MIPTSGIGNRVEPSGRRRRRLERCARVRSGTPSDADRRAATRRGGHPNPARGDDRRSPLHEATSAGRAGGGGVEANARGARGGRTRRRPASWSAIRSRPRPTRGEHGRAVGSDHQNSLPREAARLRSRERQGSQNRSGDAPAGGRGDHDPDDHPDQDGAADAAEDRGEQVVGLAVVAAAHRRGDRAAARLRGVNHPAPGADRANAADHVVERGELDVRRLGARQLLRSGGADQLGAPGERAGVGPELDHRAEPVAARRAVDAHPDAGRPADLGARAVELGDERARHRPRLPSIEDRGEGEQVAVHRRVAPERHPGHRAQTQQAGHALAVEGALRAGDLGESLRRALELRLLELALRAVERGLGARHARRQQQRHEGEPAQAARGAGARGGRARRRAGHARRVAVCGRMGAA